jgi:hypothetical protein
MVYEPLSPIVVAAQELLLMVNETIGVIDSDPVVTSTVLTHLASLAWRWTGTSPKARLQLTSVV